MSAVIRVARYSIAQAVQQLPAAVESDNDCSSNESSENADHVSEVSEQSDIEGTYEQKSTEFAPGVDAPVTCRLGSTEKGRGRGGGRRGNSSSSGTSGSVRQQHDEDGISSDATFIGKTASFIGEIHYQLEDTATNISYVLCLVYR